MQQSTQLTGTPGDAATAALESERQAGLRLMVRARIAIMAALGVMFLLIQPWPYNAVNAAMTGMFALNGYLHGMVAIRQIRTWPHYLFGAVDVVLLALLMFVINPAMWPGLRPEMLYSFAAAPFFMLILSSGVLLYAPGPVLWAGVVTAVTWVVVFVWVSADPAARDWLQYILSGGLSVEGGPPAFVPRVVEITLFLLLAGVLALAVARSRRLVMRQVAAARERANLARYFSPNVVDALAGSDQPLRAVRQQPAAVLFCDIINFTGIAEKLGPQATIDLLRAFHGRISELVFAHGGTLDKFMGDAVMATFGTPHAGTRDAANAMRCARAIVTMLDDWNRERLAAGEPVARAGVGVHYGEVVVGDIGGDARFEYAVIGDTVNVASRLESLTRGLNVDIVISQALADAARRQGETGAADGFLPAPAQTLRNRTTEIEILVWRQDATGSEQEGS